MKKSLLLAVACVGLGASVAVGCGGNEKPPMTPDSTEMPPEPEGPAPGGETPAPADGDDAGAPATDTETAPAPSN